MHPRVTFPLRTTQGHHLAKVGETIANGVLLVRDSFSEGVLPDETHVTGRVSFTLREVCGPEGLNRLLLGNPPKRKAG
jgi:hypothetical protein